MPDSNGMSAAPEAPGNSGSIGSRNLQPMQFQQAPKSRSLEVNTGAPYPYLPKTKTPNQFAMGKPENRFDFT